MTGDNVDNLSAVKIEKALKEQLNRIMLESTMEKIVNEITTDLSIFKIDLRWLSFMTVDLVVQVGPRDWSFNDEGEVLGSGTVINIDVPWSEQTGE